MFYLIGGSPRTGKTILAKKLSKKLGISWISADTLESIVKQYIPETQRHVLFPKDEIRKKTESSNDLMYSNYSSLEILDAYMAQSKTTWDAISMLIECMIKDGEGIIIEGHQIHPELMNNLLEKYAPEIETVVLVKNNADDIVKTARASTNENDWFIKKTKDPEIHYKIAEMLAKYSHYLETEAQKYQIPTVGYHGDFEEQINKALNLLMA